MKLNRTNKSDRMLRDCHNPKFWHITHMFDLMSGTPLRKDGRLKMRRSDNFLPLTKRRLNQLYK